MIGKKTSDRNFGIFFAVLFALASIYFRDTLKTLLLFSFLSVSFFILSFFKNRLITLLNIYWSKLGLFLGFLINPLIMTIIYFLLVVPISLIFKLIGRDELNLKKSNAKTFWKDRSKQINNTINFKNQY